jgi:hypothetical protein
VDLPEILSSPDDMPDILRTAFERVRRSVRPDGGRQEGGATSLLDSLGVSLYNTLASPSRLVNSHMAEYQPGVSVQDMPETMRYLPEVATNVVGLPGVMGAVPEGAMGSAAGGKIKAYHGSPHDFDKFDMKKIGTGEGVQAYGHGLYFAENPAVAGEYKRALALSGAGDAERIAASQIERWSRDGGIMNLEKMLSEGAMPAGGAEQKTYQAALDLLKSNWKPNPGRMYEVNINAHPDQFLDWDKKIRDMSPAVQEKLSKVGLNVNGPDQGLIGSQVINRRMDAGGGAAASQELNQAGIPGIKYLDQGSRTAGQGTNNYVLFDDSLIEILRKYGLVGLLGGGAAMQDHPTAP